MGGCMRQVHKCEYNLGNTALFLIDQYIKEVRPPSSINTREVTYNNTLFPPMNRHLYYYQHHHYYHILTFNLPVTQHNSVLSIDGSIDGRRASMSMSLHGQGQ